MSQVDDHGRPEPPIAADETATLLGFLDYQRATLAWKCRGLDAAGLQATVGGRLVDDAGRDAKHLAYVEDYWFSQRLHGNERRPPFDTVDWKADPDWEWHSAAQDTPEQLFALWQDSGAPSRPMVGAALAAGGLPRPAPPPWPHRESPTL